MQKTPSGPNMNRQKQIREKRVSVSEAGCSRPLLHYRRLVWICFLCSSSTWFCPTAGYSRPVLFSCYGGIVWTCFLCSSSTWFCPAAGYSRPLIQLILRNTRTHKLKCFPSKMFKSSNLQKYYCIFNDNFMLKKTQLTLLVMRQGIRTFKSLYSFQKCEFILGNKFTIFATNKTIRIFILIMTYFK